MKTTADTAKELRQALKGRFPGVKFSVRSKVYSGGSSIRVEWTDGPRSGDVTAFADAYQGCDFDGMQDLKTYRNNGSGASWVFCDRDYTDSAVQAAINAVAEEYHAPDAPTVASWRNGDTWDTYAVGNARGERHWSWQECIRRKLSELSFEVTP